MKDAFCGMSIVCIREVQKVLAQSSKKLVEETIKRYDLSGDFDVLYDRIKCPRGGLIIFTGMQDHTAESIKSLEGFDRAWVDEAQALSARSLTLLRPTIRKPDSEIWFSWNPRRKSDAVDEFFRVLKPDHSAIIQANWRDNPWFPQVLEDERQQDLKLYPDRYEHIWEGAYAKAFEGAYFSKQLTQAAAQNRISRVGADPLYPIKSYWDLGGAGAKADAMAIWIVQTIGREIRILDYLEGSGQVLGHYVYELKKRGWETAICHLPHDGANTNWNTGKRWADHLTDAGFECVVHPNGGAGIESIEIEAIRRILPRCWFNASTTEPGREALSYYHERKDEARSIGLGPEHDWSSHASRAFGLMAIDYEEPKTKINEPSPNRNPGATHWSA